MKLAPWFGAAVIVIIIFGSIYGVAQQSQRNGADAPQLQLAEDAAASLNQGATLAAVVQGRVDLNHSLAPAVIIYDKTGQPVAGSGYLNGSLPTAPLGILTASTNQVYHRVTWEPQADVRLAAVTVTANNYYVLSARSLRQVEANELATLRHTALGCLAALLVLGATAALSGKAKVKSRK